MSISILAWPNGLVRWRVRIGKRCNVGFTPDKASAWAEVTKQMERYLLNKHYPNSTCIDVLDGVIAKAKGEDK